MVTTPLITLVDTHAHLDADEFGTDRDEVITRAHDAGVTSIITVGTSVESGQRSIELAEQYPGILASIGIHPHAASTTTEADIDSIARLAGHPRVVAIGEIGLDFYRDYSPRDSQLQVLQWQLEMAVRLDLPVAIHCRQAHEEMLAILHDWTTRYPERHSPGVIHCFMGDIETARGYLEMGFYLSLGGYITYPVNRNAHDVMRFIPADRLMVETDCPFLTPQLYRGQRNEPSYVRYTAEELAEIRGVPLETLARETTKNARRLFGFEEES
ncbi:MAG TPA: TatD family hydrolase [Dehalococcoidia bacterium]|nr:TatD family hydrolase [Dehalococcoidia bacterium]